MGKYWKGKPRTKWELRCDRASFVNCRYRCDRFAVENGRCATHNFPAHKDARKWNDPIPLSRKLIREMSNANGSQAPHSPP